MAWVPAPIVPLHPHPGAGEWYAPDSFWRKPIQDYTVDPNSDFHVAYRVSAGDGEELAQAPKFIAGPDLSLGEYDYHHPIYWAKETDPLREVTLEENWDRFPGEEEIRGDMIHVPENAIPAGGSDGHIAIVQPDGATYDFWEGDMSDPDYAHGRWGGKSYIHGEGFPSNATASLFALGAGIIRPEELLQGSIDHPLFTVDHYCNGEVRWPAGGNGGRVDAEQTALGAPPMGAHYFLDISDSDIAEAEPWAQPILRAARDYGLVTGDTGSGCFKLDTAPGFDGLDRWVKVIEYFKMPVDGDGNAWFDLSEFADWESNLHLLAEPS